MKDDFSFEKRVGTALMPAYRKTLEQTPGQTQEERILRYFPFGPLRSLSAREHPRIHAEEGRQSKLDFF